jgi:hypothetical protein
VPLSVPELPQIAEPSRSSEPARVNRQPQSLLRPRFVQIWLAQLRPILALRPLQLGVLAFLFIVIGEKALRLKYFVLDSDIWWHLKVGDWIVDHLAVPHTGILSRTAANRPWIAYSWGYEVLLSRAYAWFGLVGIGVFGTLLTLAVAYAIYWMLLRLSGRFWIALLLTWAVCWSFLFSGTPRPFFFSIAFFTVTVTLLFEANRTGRLEPLYWLPLLFAVWANLHIQFTYGLFLLGLFVGAYVARTILSALGACVARAPSPACSRRLNSLSRLFLTGGESPRRALTLVAILVACFLATLLGPYTYHPYLVVLEYSKARFTYSVIIELQPLTFRHYSQFLELFLAAGGFFAIGWQSKSRDGSAKLDLFKLALLTAGTVIAFRTMRDAWFICIPAAACIADAFRSYAAERGVRRALAQAADDRATARTTEHTAPENSAAPEPLPVGASADAYEDPPETWLERLGLAAALTICLALIANAVDFNQRGLDRAISASYPVNAINFLRHNPVPGPLYNNLNWGGFLMWYMPNSPVSIDGRNDLYGDDLDQTFFNSQIANDSYKTDPYLNEAGVVLLDSKLPLAAVLTIDPRFELIYHDDIATVFARR